MDGPATLGVAVEVGVDVCVAKLVDVGVAVPVCVCDGVAEAVGVFVAIAVDVCEAVAVDVEVEVGAAVGFVCPSTMSWGLFAAAASRLERLRAVPLAEVRARL